MDSLNLRPFKSGQLRNFLSTFILLLSAISALAQPTIVAINPTAGPVGSTVNIIGTNFTTVRTVRFSSIAGPGANAVHTIVNANLITATVPNNAISGSITVISPQGTAVSTQTFDVTVLPTLASFTPVSGPEGTSITIQGSNLNAVSAVKFNSATVPIDAVFNLFTNNLMLVTVPTGAVTGPITLVSTGNPDVVSTSNFTVTSATQPTINQFTPNSGVVNSTVQIIGTNLPFVTGVKFTGAINTKVPATWALTGGGINITTQVPFDAVTGPIYLESAGNPDAVSANNFTITGVNGPAINAVNPNSGLVGDPIIITGRNLRSVSGVRFTNNVPSSFNIISADSIRAVVPSGAVTGRITLVSSGNPNNQSPSAFTVIDPNAPSITSITPSTGLNGSTVTFTGTNFNLVTNVRFTAQFGNAQASFSIVSPTTMTVVVPANAITGNVSIIYTGSATPIQGPLFTIRQPNPTITGFNPNPAARGATIQIIGRDLSAATSAVFVNASGGQSLGTGFRVIDTGTISVNVPAVAVTGPVTLNFGLGGSFITSTMDLNISFQGNANENVTTFSPLSGFTGTTVTLKGKGFATVTNIQLGNINAAPTFINDSTLTFVVPTNATTGTITAVFRSGVRASATPDFIVLARPLSITSFAPSMGPITTTVTFRGSGFGQGFGNGLSSVSFNGTPAQTIITNNDSTATAVVASGTTTGPITITRQNQSFTTATNFVVIPQATPIITGFSPASGPVGTFVTITGTNLNGAFRVRFNNTNATNFTVVNNTTIIAQVPNNATTGAISVFVGTDVGNSTSQYTVTIVPPVITRFDPAFGTPNSTVMVYGRFLTQVNQVRIGTTNCAFQRITDTSMRLTVNVNAQTGLISAVAGFNPNQQTGFSSTEFVVISGPPNITGFNPTSATVGTTITIFGNRFLLASSVKFNGVAATTFNVVNNTQIFAVVPIGATTGFVEITTPGGTGTSPTTFEVLQVPRITGFTPTSGPTGQTVTIVGDNFTNANSLAFNGTNATFTIVNDDTIRTLVPPGATSGPITIGSAVGTGTSPTNFVVDNNPVITNFSPSSGPIGTTVTINGLNLNAALAVRFGGVNATFTVVSNTSITATVPQGATSGPISIVTVFGTISSTTNFLVITEPSISGFSPGSGWVGTIISITGQNLAAASSVRINGTNALFQVVNNTTLNATVPVGATSGIITVVTPTGTANSSSSFVVIGAPAITALNPNQGGIGTLLTISGLNLNSPSQVLLGGVPLNFTAVNNTTITAPVPANAVTGFVVISTPGGTAISPNQFTILPTPTITSFSPAQGRVGANITITGTNFVGATEVRFGNAVTTQFNVVNNSTITVSVPSDAQTGNIRVVAPGGTAVSTGTFRVIGAPTVTSANPSAGWIGNIVTINGVGFDSVTAVSFGGANAVFNRINATTILATIPSAAQTGNLTVTNVAGSGSLLATYTIYGNPSITSLSPVAGFPGSTVTINGSGFDLTSKVELGSQNTTFTFVNSNTITFVVPNGAISGRVKVTSPGGTSTSTNNFTVLGPPAISSFSPANGFVGTQVIVKGGNLAGATQVRLNNTNVTFTAEGDTAIIFNVPFGATTGPISITNPSGAVTSTTNFGVFGAPVINSFTPDTGRAGAVITLNGANFLNVTSVLFNGTPAPYTTNSVNQVLATIPPGATTGLITITNPAGTFTTTDNFTVFQNPIIPVFDRPEILVVNPDSGFPGATITVSGNHLDNTTLVTVNGTNAQFSQVSDSQITFIVPLGTSSGQLVVTNLGGSDTAASNFQVLVPRSIITQNPDTTLCQGEEFTVNAQIAGSYAPSNSFNVELSDENGSFAAPTIIGNGTSGNIQATLPSNLLPTTGYKVRVVSTSPRFTGNSHLSPITVNALPLISAPSKLIFCSKDSPLALADSGKPSGGFWSGNGVTNGVFSPSEAGLGTQTLTYVFTNSNGCSQTVTTNVEVKPTPSKPQVFIVSTSTTICSGDSVTVTTVPATKYLWSNGATTATPSFKESGRYTVRIANAEGCWSDSSDGISIEVLPAPEKPTITAQGLTTLCAGDSVELTSSEGLAYLWSNGATTRSIQAKTSDNYSVKVQGLNNCYSVASAPKLVQVKPLPIRPVVQVVGDTLLCAGDSTVLIAPVGFNFYFWSDGRTTQGIRVGASGNYSVAVIGAEGCRSIESVPTKITVRAPVTVPVITASNGMEFCPGDSTILSAPDGFAAYLWSDGVRTRVRTVKTESNYTVRVTDALGCRSVFSAPAAVRLRQVAPKPTIGVLGNREVCPGDSVILVGPSGFALYEWSNGELTPTIVIKQNADIKLRVQGLNTCVSPISDSISIRYRPTIAPPTITVLGPSSVCQGKAVVLKAEGNFNQYFWSNGQVGDTIEVLVTDTLTVFGRTIDGCLSPRSIEKAVEVKPTPEKPEITLLGATVLCGGDSTVLEGPLGLDAYQWSTGANTRSLTVKAEGTYWLRTTNLEGCSSDTSEKITVIVSSRPVQPTVRATGNTTVCQGDSVTLTASPSAGYLWSNGLTTATIVVRLSGNYTVQVRNLEGCFSTSSVALPVVVNSRPVLNLTQAGDTLRVQNLPNATYRWFFNGIELSNTNFNQLVATASGLYFVVATVNGCEGVSQGLQVVVSGIENSVRSNGMRIFPVPANEEVVLEMMNVENGLAKLQVEDLLGRTFETKILENVPGLNNHKLNISEYKAGIYWAVIQKRNEKPVRLKFIKN